jgi:predicted dienelactone hydrolase
MKGQNCKLTEFRLAKLKRLTATCATTIAAVTIAQLSTAPAQAAEQLILQFGPFEQAVSVAEVEAYARTGRISQNMQMLTPFLNNDIRKALTTKIDLDPKIASDVVGDLLKTPSGKDLMRTLQTAVPGLSAEALQAGVAIAAKQSQKLDAIALIKAIPQKSVTINLSEAATVGSKLNLSYWKSQAMSSLLQRSLTSPDRQRFAAPFDAAAPGTRPIQTETVMLNDRQRNRTLPVDLYWSTPSGTSAASPAPMVVISPGFEASKKFLTYLAQHLASHGFNVAAIEHPSVLQDGQRSINDLSQLLPPQELIDRPKDVQFILDELSKRGADAKAPFNTQKVIVIGHSLGGYGALALAGGEVNLGELRQFCQKNAVLQRSPADWLQCAGTKLSGNSLNLRDRRVIGAIALNPAVGQIFGKSGLAKVQTPTVMLTSTDDALTPTVSQQLQPFNQLPRPKYLLTAIGATHLSVSDGTRFSPSTMVKTLVPEKLGSEVEGLRSAVRGISLAFVQQFTPEAEKYKPFLSAGYAQSLSTSALPLRMNSDLPNSITRILQLAGMI